MKKTKNPTNRKGSNGKLEKFHCHPNSTSVGCVSGIFHFFARRHNSSQKRLSAPVRRKNEPPTNSSKSTVALSSIKVVETSKEITKKDLSHAMTAAHVASVVLRSLHLRRQRSREPPRSPALASDIRVPGPHESQVDSPRRAITLVERLMGLDEFPISSPETTAGRQRKLLGAVENCEDRVASLKRIIGAAQAAEKPRRVVEEIVSIEVDTDDCDSSVVTVKCVDGEQPSPASVLDVISPSKFPSDKLKQEKCRKESRSTEDIYNPGARQVATAEGLPRMLKRSSEFKAPLEDLALAVRITGPRLWRWARSRAMVETVHEVLERSAWEERKEAANVAMALERGIFCDLVDEIGAEFAVHWSVVPIRRTCRKRLRF